MAALESPKGILNAYEICSASDRMFGVAISGGDFRKCMQTKFDPSGIDMMVARGQMLIAARAAGVQCFDTVFTDLDDNEGFEAEVRQNKAMGFDGKSLINPKQIRLVHQIFAPTEKEVAQAEAMVSAFREAAAAGIGVFTVNGKMVDVAFIPGAERTLRLAKACGMYEGIWYENAVGRDIPEALLVNGKEVYQGKNYMDGKYLQKAAPCTRRYERPQESKIRDAGRRAAPVRREGRHDLLVPPPPAQRRLCGEHGYEGRD